MKELADLLVTGGIVLTMDARRTVYWPGALVVRGGRLLAVGPAAELGDRFEANERLDATGEIILPGLVNCHSHAALALLRGLGEDMLLDEWLRTVVWPGMGAATPQDLYYGARLACLEMLHAGITTVADMWPNVSGTARAVADTGMRAILAHNLRDHGDTSQAASLLAAAMDSLREWDGAADGRIRMGLAPHSVYGASQTLLEGISDEARRYDLPLQVHAAETRQECEEAQTRLGCSPIAYLDHLGLLGPRTIVAHCVWPAERDIELLAARRTAVAHCPTSNMKLACGIAPVPRLQKAGITIGLGTDSATSNNSLDLFREMKTAALAQKAQCGDPTVLPAEQVVAMVTSHGATALGMAQEIGSLTPGKMADFVIIRPKRTHWTPFLPEHPRQVYAHLVYAAGPEDIDAVVIDGKMRIRGGHCPDIDEEEIIRMAQESVVRLAGRAGLVPQRPAYHSTK